MDLECFPNLNPNNHSITSGQTFAYNCIAWVLGETDTWWSSAPNYYWPRRIVPGSMRIVANVVRLFEWQGFVECDGANLEDGVEKIALYATGGLFVHVAYQRKDGHWTSKMDRFEDIAHTTPEALLGGDYEAVVHIMQRPRRQHPSDAFCVS